MSESGMREINDATLIDQAKDASKCLCEIGTTQDAKLEELKKSLKNSGVDLPFPLDEEAIEKLEGLLPQDEPKTTIPYSKADNLNKLWVTLIEKSIQCLRFFDTRESFRDNQSTPEAYGIDSLKKYQDHYTSFESMLYGQSEGYRDHVFHSFRVWLIGVYALTIGEKNERLIDKLELDGGARYVGKINHFEWLSMWTIAALCHDLGYPLELVGSILNKTNKMMSDFFLRPNVSDNFTFTGIQNVINDSMLKLMSTRLRKETLCKKVYSGRIQQKYYFKYAKSLENNDHGIISAVIVFKMLPFFLEVDFNLNNDSCPCYSGEDARQFYIRREVLRAMASHTCKDIFHVKTQTLPALLFICDELQEWGRKSWEDLYTGIPTSEIKLSIGSFNTKEVKITETTVKKSASDPKTMIEELAKKLIKEYRLYEKYKKTFRDGPGTAKREFNFTKTIKIKFPNESAASQEQEPGVTYTIRRGGQDKFEPNIDELGSEEHKKLKKLIEESDNLNPEERSELRKLITEGTEDPQCSD